MGTGEGQGPPFPGEEPLLLSGVSPKGHSALGPWVPHLPARTWRHLTYACQ